jgi:hypothetical protein
MAEAKRIEIGFSGGQVVAVRLAEKELTAFQTALKKGTGWHDLTGEDGALSLDLATITFVRVEGNEQSIGFAGD